MKKAFHHIIALCAALSLTGCAAAENGAPSPDVYDMVSFGDSTTVLNASFPLPKQAGLCYRDEGTFPRIVAHKKHYRLFESGCSGNKISDYWHSPGRKHLNNHTRLVTITYGSNDVDTVNVFIKAKSTTSIVSSTVDADTWNVMLGRMRAVVADVKKAAPNARIILVGYLPLVDKVCPTVFPLLSYGEVVELQKLRQGVNGVLAQVAEEYHVDAVIPAISGHGVCAPLPEQWVNTEFENEVLYHTLPGGHDYLANRIVNYLALKGEASY